MNFENTEKNIEKQIFKKKSNEIKNYFEKKNKIDLNKDDYYQNVKKILEIFPKVEVAGSYKRVGKEKSCDLDLYQKIYISPNIEIILEQYKKKIEYNVNKKIIKIIDIDLFINHPDIEFLLSKLGYLNIYLEKQNSLWIEQPLEEIKKDIELLIYLPKNEKDNILEEIKFYKENPNNKNFLKLFCFIKEKLKESWTLNEFLKGEKVYLGYKININKDNLKILYIECIYNNFRSSMYFDFINKLKNNKKDMKYLMNMMDMEKNKNKYLEIDILYYYKNNYYFLLKKIAYWFKWYMFIYKNNKNNNKSIYKKMKKYYNYIFEFREIISSQYHKLCINQIKKIMSNLNKNKLKDLKKNEDKFENLCKFFYEKIIHPFLNELNQTIKIK